MPQIFSYEITPRAFVMKCTPEELSELKQVLSETVNMNKILEYEEKHIPAGRSYCFDLNKSVDGV